jgi:hypothetical protein
LKRRSRTGRALAWVGGGDKAMSEAEGRVGKEVKRKESTGMGWRTGKTNQG